MAGVQFLGDLLIGDGSGLDLINSHGAVFIGENAVCPAFQRKGDAAGFPLRAEEYLGLIALPGGLLQLAVDARTLVGAVEAGKAAVDAAGAQQKLHQLPDGQMDVCQGVSPPLCFTLSYPEQFHALGGCCIYLCKVHGGAVVGLQFIVAAFGLCHQGIGLFQ